MDDETQLRVRQAIEELLPVFVQQVVRPPTTSADSSSTSLPLSSTTPESLPRDETMVTEHRMKQPNLHPFEASQNVGSRTFASNQRRTSRPTTRLTMTTSVDPSYHDLEASAAAHSYCQPLTRRTIAGQQPDSRPHIGRQNASIFVPILKTSDPQGSTATSLRPSYVDVPMMAPPPIPQHVLPKPALAPKRSRRSMDSGYASMYIRQPDTMDGAGFRVYNENAPNSGASLSAADYAGSASGDSWLNLQDSQWPWNDIAGTRQSPPSRSNDLPSGVGLQLGANKHDLVPDLPGSRMGLAEQAPAIPGLYLPESLPFCPPPLDFSDPYLPSMNNASQGDGSDTPSLYGTIEDLWAAGGNPWRLNESTQDGGVA